jgi:hypothetical protein
VQAGVLSKIFWKQANDEAPIWAQLPDQTEGQQARAKGEAARAAAQAESERAER